VSPVPVLEGLPQFGDESLPLLLGLSTVRDVAAECDDAVVRDLHRLHPDPDEHPVGSPEPSVLLDRPGLAELVTVKEIGGSPRLEIGEVVAEHLQRGRVGVHHPARTVRDEDGVRRPLDVGPEPSFQDAELALLLQRVGTA
jgi:hypothetical protein